MPLNNFGIVDQSHGGTLYRSAQPDLDGASTLVLLGVNVFVRLNGDGAEVPGPDAQSGVELVYRPIPTFSVDLDECRAIVDLIKDRLAAGENVLVHCTHGRDRTGLITGIYRLTVNGWNLAAVNAERALFGVSGIIEEIGDHEINEALATVARQTNGTQTNGTP